MTLLRTCCLALALSAPPALAGPWPREKGEALLISTVETSYHLSHWGEYGLSAQRWLTLELDFPRRGGVMEAALSLNHALPEWRGWRSSLGFGAVLRARDPLVYPFRPEGAVQAGAALGRGFTTPLLGWFSFGLRHREGQDFARTKAEATLGLKPTTSVTFIGQLQHSDERGQPRSQKLQTSALWQVTPRLGLELGFSRALDGEDRPLRVRLGSWLSF